MRGKREKKEDESSCRDISECLKRCRKMKSSFFADHVNVIFNLTSFIMTPLEG